MEQRMMQDPMPHKEAMLDSSEPLSKTDGQGNVIDLEQEMSRKQRRQVKKTLKTVFKGKDGAVAVLGSGRAARGKATRWVVKCSNCNDGNWWSVSFTSKVQAARAAHFHITKEHDG